MYKVINVYPQLLNKPQHSIYCCLFSK